MPSITQQELDKDIEWLQQVSTIQDTAGAVANLRTILLRAEKEMAESDPASAYYSLRGAAMLLLANVDKESAKAAEPRP